MAVEQLDLGDYVAREDDFVDRLTKLDAQDSASIVPRDITNYDWGKRAFRPATPPPPAIPGQLPSPPIGSPGTLSYLEQQRRGMYAEPGMKNIFPGVIASMDEAAQQLAGQSKEDWAKMAIAIAIGEGGEPYWFKNVPEPFAVPKSHWDKFKLVSKFSEEKGGEIRTDGKGNFYQHAGDHKVVNPETGEIDHHVVAQPVLSDAEMVQFKKDYPSLLSKEGYNAFYRAADSGKSFEESMAAAEAAHVPKPPEFGAVGSGKTQQWNELSPEIQQWFKDKYGYKSDAFAEQEWNNSLKSMTPEKLLGPSEADKELGMGNAASPEALAKWEAIKKKYGIGKNVPPDEPLPGSKEWFDKKAKDFQAKHFPEAPPPKPPEMTEENYWKLYHEGKLPGQKGPPEQGPTSPTGKFELPGSDFPNQPPEEVGPVDWNWYSPQGGPNPPYQPPFEVPQGWDIAPEDMGPRSSDFWDRFGWKPPEDPNSPDFPGPNRWD